MSSIQAADRCRAAELQNNRALVWEDACPHEGVRISLDKSTPIRLEGQKILLAIAEERTGEIQSEYGRLYLRHQGLAEAVNRAQTYVVDFNPASRKAITEADQATTLARLAFEKSHDLQDAEACHLQLATHHHERAVATHGQRRQGIADLEAMLARLRVEEEQSRIDVQHCSQELAAAQARHAAALGETRHCEDRMEEARRVRDELILEER